MLAQVFLNILCQQKFNLYLGLNDSV